VEEGRITLKKDYTVKKRLATFPAPAGMSLAKLPLGGINYLFNLINLIIPAQGELGK
jgi:hypothetical protein